MTYKEWKEAIKKGISGFYEPSEATQIAFLTIQHYSGISRIDYILSKEREPDAQISQKLQEALNRLKTGEPLQYVLQEAWFMEKPFFVNTSVLIPRPETEELVEWALKETQKQKCKVLDIGTGSGCIAISFKLRKPQDAVSGLDFSRSALSVALKNAQRQNVTINWIEKNILDTYDLNEMGMYDLIISNPPYIRESERKDMQSNVKDFEPESALFVPDADPLIFYQAIAEFSKDHLSKNGKIFLEINEALADEVLTLFHQYAYKSILRKDMFGKDRMVRLTMGNE